MLASVVVVVIVVGVSERDDVGVGTVMFIVWRRCVLGRLVACLRACASNMDFAVATV